MTATDRSTASCATRALRVADHSRWDGLWAGYLQHYRTQLAPEITEFTWQRLMEPTSGLHGQVAVDGDTVLGFVHYHFHLSTWSLTSYCYLEDLYVDPGYRSKGAGRALIEAVYRDADERGATRVYWHTENTNARAQVLYNQVATLTPFVQYRR